MRAWLCAKAWGTMRTAAAFQGRVRRQVVCWKQFKAVLEIMNRVDAQFPLDLLAREPAETGESVN